MGEIWTKGIFSGNLHNGFAVYRDLVLGAHVPLGMGLHVINIPLLCPSRLPLSGPPYKC